MTKTDSDRALEMLRINTTEHVLEVLHDDGLYRHFQMKQPGTSMYRVVINTWPGYLFIGGDMDGYTFHREPDMIAFFQHGKGRINPDYWAEKLTGGRASVKTYSKVTFEAQVRQAVEDYFGDDETKSAVLADIEKDLLLTDTEYEESAREWADTYRYSLGDGGAFEFTDVWEWDLKDYDYHYLYACHALVWAIAAYDAHKAKAAQASIDTARAERGRR